jgi:hypothetical protein
MPGEIFNKDLVIRQRSRFSCYPPALRVVATARRGASLQNAQLLRKPPLRAALRVDSERKPRECAGLFVVCLVVSLLCELGGLAWVQLNVESERLQAFDQVTLQTQGSEVVKVLSAQFVILQFRML